MCAVIEDNSTINVEFTLIPILVISSFATRPEVKAEGRSLCDIDCHLNGRSGIIETGVVTSHGPAAAIRSCVHVPGMSGIVVEVGGDAVVLEVNVESHVLTGDHDDVAFAFDGGVGPTDGGAVSVDIANGKVGRGSA